MLREQISLSPDLVRLIADGYEVSVVGGHLLLGNIPYVTSQREVRYGTLVSTLTLAGERTAKPDTHVVYFHGEHPCDKDGKELIAIRHDARTRQLAPGVAVDRSFSSKPPVGFYADYYEKMTTYERILSGPAQAIDPTVTARTFVSEVVGGSSVFAYTDTATTRAGIGAVSERLAGQKIGIIGVGGTGSYILDLVAKTPVCEIHLFDSDRFLQHNAFRAPGAPSLEELRAGPTKVEYLRGVYSRMHNGIKAHAVRLNKTQGSLLDGLDFVFVCVDTGAARHDLVSLLRDRGVSYIDVGMGIEVIEESKCLIGQLRISTSTSDFRGGESRIPFASDDDNDDGYSTNIQIADLNCLNAALAVVRWKRLKGFYQDLKGEHWSSYATNVNHLHSAETRE